MREKRVHQRTALNVEVEARASDGTSWKADSVDISMGGMFLSGELCVAIGSEISLTFELPGMGTVTLPCFVRWTSARGFGVQFGLIGARETHAIGRVVRAQPDALHANR